VRGDRAAGPLGSAPGVASRRSSGLGQFKSPGPKPGGIGIDPQDDLGSSLSDPVGQAVTEELVTGTAPIGCLHRTGGLTHVG